METTNPKITNKLLIEWGACEDGRLTFNELLPNGAYLQEALDILHQNHNQYAYWLFEQCRKKGLYSEIIDKGYKNSGNENSGCWNSGNENSGCWNSGNGNSGFFNTNEPTIRLFNKETSLYRKDINIPYIDLQITQWVSEEQMTDEQKKNDPLFYVRKGTLIKRTYKEAWALYWAKCSDDIKQQFLNLPNFDATIFEEITGIKVN